MNTPPRDLRRNPKASDEFASWPPSAQEAYLTMKESAKRAKLERDALRLKQLGVPPPPVGLPIASLDELTLPWERWMDGRIHRLKHGKHFTGDLKAVLEEARLAAQVTGRGLLSLREQMAKNYEYVWVQFTDYSILVGDPCPCGGRKLIRVHASLARCTRCSKTSALIPR